MNIFEGFKDDNNKIESEGAKLLLESLKSIEVMTEDDFEEIRKEYNRLFIGPGNLVAPPWESVYLSKERIIFDENTLLVREFYKTWGVNINRVNKEPDDHIGFQLEFMSILAGKSIDAIGKNDIKRLKELLTAQNSFLETHTLKWSNQLFDIIFKDSEENFFKGLSLFASEYLKMDKELLEDLIKNIK